MAISISNNEELEVKTSEEENELPTIPIFYLSLALIGGLLVFGLYRCISKTIHLPLAWIILNLSFKPIG